jgi:putative membrane-bound dehydrogenase-like protein
MTHRPTAAAVTWMVFFVAPLFGAEPAEPAAAPANPPGLADTPDPADALAAFTVPDDLEVELVLAEPEVRQPISISFDERGRTWVVQYLQYPDPAGLKELSRDNFWRVVYDKVPPPPPNHFVGADRVTIHEDTDGDGRFDLHKAFLEGLSIVTSVARGRGGMWVLNPPYLLFYADRDNDDVPDGDPEVHLEGFGLEDTHSCTNSLCWGPDGWLYACQGSTVSGHVLRTGLDQQKDAVHSMGQLIWRYHPETRRYEVFAEGGGNAFGVEIDSRGRLYSGHNGGDTRGFHYVQGGYYQKGFAKHGPLSNAFAFGYFAAMKHASVPRFTHTFVIYEGAALPEAHAGRLFGVAPLQSHVVESRLEADGSSFRTTDVGHPITTTDSLFRPVDIKVGPDGAIYVADMHEGHIAHLRHHEGKIDRTTGRIWRLKAKGAPPALPVDLAVRSSAELAALLRHPNKWTRTTALRLLADRRDAGAVDTLAAMLNEAEEVTALNALWGLYACGAFDDGLALRCLAHPAPHVRAWAVRVLGDERRVSPALAGRLAEMAANEPSVEVRSQLASSARRLPAEQGLPIVRALVARDEDADDIHVPLLLWWALEAKAAGEREAVLALFDDPALWQRPMVRTHLLHRLMRRYAAGQSRVDLLTCARLFRMAPDADRAKDLLRGFEEAFQGRSLAAVPEELAVELAKVGGQSVVLGLRQGRPEAISQALAVIGDPSADKDQALLYVAILGEVRTPQAVPALLGVVARSSDEALRMAALAALSAYDDPAIAPAVIERYGEFSADVQSVAHSLLAGREASAVALLVAVDAGRIDPATVPRDVVRKLTIYRDERIAPLIARHWGTIEGATTSQMQAAIARLEAAAAGGPGDRYAGKKLFAASCGKCHVLFDQGGKIGPDLTAFKRDDVGRMLASIVNPSAEVREGFETFLAVTDDGRAVTGFLVDKDDQVIVLRGTDGQNVSLAAEEIDEIAQQRKSLMPEGLLDPLSDQQVRDLLAYLQSGQPLND